MGAKEKALCKSVFANHFHVNPNSHFEKHNAAGKVIGIQLDDCFLFTGTLWA